MKVLFVYTDTSGSLYYRILLPAKALKKIGIECAIASTDILKSGRLNECLEYNIVIIQRYIHREISSELKFLREHGIKIFYEIDDYFFEMAPKSKWHESQENNKTLKEILQFVDGVIVTTDELKNKYSSYNKNILIFGNYYYPDDIKGFSIKKNNELPIKCQWSGGANHYIDLYQIKDVINFLSYKYKDIFQFNILGENFTNIFSKSANVKYIGTTYRKYGHSKELDNDLDKIEKGEPSTSVLEYYHMLNDGCFDIGMIPLSYNEHNICKSSIKLLEYSLFKIPVITSNSFVYNDITHGINGYVANNYNDWIEYTSLLIEDEGWRNIVAENRYSFVMNNYNILNHIEKYKEFLRR